MPGRSLPDCISLSWRFSKDAAAAPADAIVTAVLWAAIYDVCKKEVPLMLLVPKGKGVGRSCRRKVVKRCWGQEEERVQGSVPIWRRAQ